MYHTELVFSQEYLYCQCVSEWGGVETKPFVGILISLALVGLVTGSLAPAVSAGGTTES